MLLFSPFPAQAATNLEASQTNAPALFDVQCAGCHPNGGNIIRRGKNLKLRALKRQGMDSYRRSPI
jgi:cytochrome c6